MTNTTTMTSPLVVADTAEPSEVHGIHGGRGVDGWKRDGPLEWIVVEALPPAIVDPLPSYRPSEVIV